MLKRHVILTTHHVLLCILINTGEIIRFLCVFMHLVFNIILIVTLAINLFIRQTVYVVDRPSDTLD